MNAAGILEFLGPEVASSWSLAPLEAVDFLARKGLRTSFDYRDIIGAEHASAFTIAKMMDTDLLADVKASLDDALAKGIPFQEWSDSIVPMLQAKGWWGRKAVTDPLTGETIVAQLGSPSRLQTIYRTNMQSAYAAGAWDAIQDQKDLAPYLMYDAVDDFRTRPEHAAWDGKVLPVDNNWWRNHYPPNGWNCRCTVIQLSEADLEDLGLAVDAKAPPDNFQPWTNPRTGKKRAVPQGVDPGFDYHPGKERQKILAQAVADKLKSYPPELSHAAAEGFKATAAAAEKATKQAAADVHAAAAKAAKEAARAVEAAAAAEVQAVVAAKTPYLAKSIGDVLKTKAGQQMTQAELLSTAKAQAAKLKAQTDLSEWKKAYAAGKKPSATGQAAFDALPEDAAQALVAQLDAAKAAAAAAAEAAAAEAAAQAAATAKLEAFTPTSLEGKSLAKLKAAMGSVEVKPTTMLEGVEAMVAQAKATQVQAQVKAGLVKSLAAGKVPTPAQQAVLDAIKAGDQAGMDALVAEVDKLKAAELPAKAAATAPAGAEPFTAADSLNPQTLVQIGPQKGSNPGGLYRDTSTGQTWYIKTPPSADHARNEVLAAKLYQAAGVNVPELRLTVLDGKPAVASRIVDDLAKLSPAELAKAQGVMDGFVVDAWLGNWDVVGATFDNLLVRGGAAFRVDTGGALLFRAQGVAKGAAFGDAVTELKTFLDAAKNPNTAKVFKGITGAQLEAGAARVLALTDDAIRKLVAEHGPLGELGETLAKRLIARKAHLAQVFGKATEAFTKAQAQAVEAAQFAAREGLADVDGAFLSAIKGVALRTAKGLPLEAKDVTRAADARKALKTWLDAHRSVLTAEAASQVETYYTAWASSLDDALAPGVGKVGAWKGETFAGFKGALPVDPAKVKVTLPPEGLTFGPAQAKAVIAKALGNSVANMTVPDNGGATELKRLLPLEHQRAVSAYTGSHYRTVNDTLRAGRADAAQVAYAELVNEALTLAPKYVGEVTRGINLSGSELQKFLADHRQAMVSGQAIAHRGFISTTKGSSAAFSGNVTLHIQSRTGVWVRPISLHAGENEVLLRHGSRFMVTDVRDTGGRFHIYLEEVGP